MIHKFFLRTIKILSILIIIFFNSSFVYGDDTEAILLKLESLENDIILEYNKGNFPIRIITGNSLYMKKIVSTAVENQKFKSKEELNNSGVMIIYE